MLQFDLCFFSAVDACPLLTQFASLPSTYYMYGAPTIGTRDLLLHTLAYQFTSTTKHPRSHTKANLAPISPAFIISTHYTQCIQDPQSLASTTHPLPAMLPPYPPSPSTLPSASAVVSCCHLLYIQVYYSNDDIYTLLVSHRFNRLYPSTYLRAPLSVSFPRAQPIRHLYTPYRPSRDGRMPTLTLRRIKEMDAGDVRNDIYCPNRA